MGPYVDLTDAAEELTMIDEGTLRALQGELESPRGATSAATSATTSALRALGTMLAMAAAATRGHAKLMARTAVAPGTPPPIAVHHAAIKPGYRGGYSP